MVVAVNESWTIRRVLGWTRGFFAEKGIESARLDAEVLVADALGVERVHLYVDHDKPLAPEELTAIREVVRRRGRREPVAYITGRRHFWKQALAVDSRVLVPRPETENLVERALSALEGVEAPLVVDVGTGSGCVALAIAADRPDATVWGIDRSTLALAVARDNLERLGLENVVLLEGVALDSVQEEVALVVSNPPYIPTADLAGLMPDVREHEPLVALDGGPDGLDVVRTLVDDAPRVLPSGGRLLVEIGHDQGEAVRALCTGDGRYASVAVLPDVAGHDRVLEAARS